MGNSKAAVLLAVTVITIASVALWQKSRTRSLEELPAVAGHETISQPSPAADSMAADVRAGDRRHDGIDAALQESASIARRDRESPGLRTPTIRILDDADHSVPDADVWVVEDQKLSIPDVIELDPAAMRATLAKQTGKSSEDGTAAWSIPVRGSSWLVVARRPGWHTGYAWIDAATPLPDHVAVRLLRQSNVHRIVIDAATAVPVAGAMLIAIPRFRPENGSTP